MPCRAERLVSRLGRLFLLRPCGDERLCITCRVGPFGLFNRDLAGLKGYVVEWGGFLVFLRRPCRDERLCFRMGLFLNFSTETLQG